MSTSNRGEWLHGRSTHFYFGTQWCEQSPQACGVKGYLWACKLGFLGAGICKLYQSFTRFSDWLILNDA